MSLDIVSNSLTGLGTVQELLHILCKIMTANNNDRNGDQAQITHEHHNEEHRLLEAIEAAKVDRIEPDIAHRRAAEEDGVYISNVKVGGVCAPEYNRRDDYGSDEITEMESIEIRFKRSFEVI